ncbi:MAG: hypothetical protein ACR2N4_07375 [Jatrophihabitans sp.]
MTWTEADPGQGDPDGLLALAAALQGDADDAASAARMLRSVQHNATDVVWKGSSADAFRDRIDKVPVHLDKLHASYAEAAAGLRDYAASVRQIADDARAQQQTVSRSTTDLHTAQAQQAAWTPPPHPATGLPDPAITNPHDEQVAAAHASVKKAQARLQDLAGQRQTADGRLVGSLDRAHSDGIRNKHWWQKALDVASATLADLTVVLMVVALVAIVVLAIVQPELIPGLVLLAGQVLAGLSAAQLAFDGTRKASGESVSWGSLAMDAVGLLPGIGALGAFADAVPFLSRGAAALRAESRAVRGYSAAGGAFARSVGNDLRATRYLVRVADTGHGTTFMAGVEREGKTAGQMLSDARQSARDATANSDKGFVAVGGGDVTRRVNYRPHAPDPRWGLTKTHLDKHLFGSGKFSLSRIDPGGNVEMWTGYMQDLAGRAVSNTSKDGIIDIIGDFPRSGGSGTFRFGLRLSRDADGTYDLVTLLTRQEGSG